MAEEEAEEGGEEAGEQEKGLPIKLILIVVGVLALGGGGYFAYTNFFQDEAVEEPAEGSVEEGEGKEGNESEEGEEGTDSKKEEQLPPDVGVMFTLDPFVVNLAGRVEKDF